MRREELYPIKDAIDSCFNLKGLEFIHRITLIYSMINEHITIFERNRPKPSEDYQKFQNDRSKLLDKYAAKNEDGSLTTNKHGIVLANPAAYSSSLTILEHKYYSAISKHKTETAEFKSFLESEFDFDFKLIPVKYIPSDITLGQYIGILPLIEKETPLKEEK